MNPDFLPYLADPVSGCPLTLHPTRLDGGDVVEGRLTSPRASYPIVAGIPRFADAAYVASFGSQWERWRRVQFDRDNIGGPMDGYTGRMWETITGQHARVDRAVVAEFGCGAGRFLATVREKGGRAIGLELSDAADVAAQNFRGDGDVLICQADVLQPPLAAAILDGAFSIGVLHHTPDPASGVLAMARTVRCGGWIAVSVYPRGGYYDSRRVRLFRAVFRALRPLYGHRPVLRYATAAASLWHLVGRRRRLGGILRRLLPIVGLPKRDWTALDTYDSLVPVYQSTHDAADVVQWLESGGLTKIERSPWGPTAYRAVKVADAS